MYACVTGQQLAAVRYSVQIYGSSIWITEFGFAHIDRVVLSCSRETPGCLDNLEVELRKLSNSLCSVIGVYKLQTKCNQTVFF